MLTSAVIFLSFLLRLSLLSYLRCRRLPHRSPQRQLYQPLHRRLTYLVVKNSKNKQPKGQRLVQREEEEEHNWRQPQLFRFGEPHKTEALTRLQVGRWKAHVDYIVLTSVDRDDLPDGGSGHFAQTVKTMKQLKPEIMVECLTSDFRGDLKAVDALVHLGLDVFAHNIETVKWLLRIVRDPRAGYAQSLSVLRHAKINKEGMITKSSIMLGLGESDDELKEAMADLRAIDVDILTLGQYLQPTPLHLTVKEYVTPEKFAFWKEYEESIGFRYVASGTTGPILI